MCTIIVIRESHRGYPLIVAANRDEFYAREASAPEVRATEPRVVAGRDQAHGGSWLGAVATGLFVGLTNQRTHAPPDGRLVSRGQVVMAALRRGTLDGVRRYVAGLDARRYNPFNLIYGDARAVEVAYARPERAPVEIEAVPQGIAVLANDRLGSPDFPKTARAMELASAVGARDWPQLLTELGGMLADHELPAAEQVPAPPPGGILSASMLRQLQALCIHTPAYGTCSSTIMALRSGRVAHYAYAAGPPCSTAYVDLTSLFHG